MSRAAFQYTAVRRDGARVQGVESGPDRAAVYRKLAAGGLTPVTIRRRSRGVMRPGRRIGGRDIAHFTYQLSVLVGARIPISDGLRTIGEQEPNPRFRAVIMEIASGIDAGRPIAENLGAHREVFGDVFIEAVHAAERTGNLTKVLEFLAESMERTEEARAQLRSALMYPVVVVSFLGLATLFLVAFVVPKFATMFAARGVDLPLLTEALMLVGVSLKGYWWAWLASLVGVAWGLRGAWRWPRGRLAIDRLLHRAPYVRRILVGAATARFSRILGLCLSSGLGLVEALELGGRASGRPMLAADAASMMAQVRSGGRLKDAMERCGYLPAFARRMLCAGEESAELPRMCAVVARQYDRETGSLTKNIATVVEPVMVVGIALVVLVVALAIFLPMWDMVTLLG